MDFTVYLPDELGARAKELERGVLSRLLRDAVTDELNRRIAMSTTLSDSSEHLIDVTDQEDRPFTARITGSRIAEEEPKQVFLTKDERVILYDADYDGGRYWELDDPESELREQLSPGPYSEAMHALGIKPVLDI